MAQKLVVLWALIALPFWLSAATGGPAGLMPHALFHPVYILFAIGAIVALLRLRSATNSPVVGWLALALVASQAAAIVGQVGEEIVVLQHGGLSASREVFEEPLHELSAYVTILPGVLASQLLLIVLTIAAIVAMRAEQRLAASPGHT